MLSLANVRTLAFLATLLGGLAAIAATPAPSADVEAGKSGVVVATDKARYCTSDPIIVRIANRLTETVYAYSGRSYCTIVDVERVDGDGAKPVGACVAGAPPSAVEITGLSERRFELERFDPVFEPMGPGAYRIRFCYRRGVADAPERCIHSDEFAVLACTGGRAE